MLDTLIPVALLASLAEAKSSTKKYIADDEPSDFDTILWPIVLCFAGGIYLVYERYQRAHNSPVPFEHHAPVQADPQWEGLPLENANLQSHLQHPDVLPPIDIPGQEYITAFDPATSLHLGTYLADDENVIAFKINKAAKAQRRWKQTTFVQRRRVVRSLLKWLVDNQEMCAKVACRDTGKTLLDASLGEIMTTCTKMEWILKHGERYLRPEKRHGNFMMAYKRAEVHYEPLGVVAAIVSWNYPLHNAWSPILASIFAGNAVVLKCSEKVIWSSTWFVDAITTCLRTLGHPEDIVQLVCCYPKKAPALTRSPLIKHITFIGSETVGRIIAQDATENLIPVTLELGGKDPCVILPGTDIERWAPLWKRGVFQNMGQNCIGIERLIVHSSQYDELEAIFKETASKIRLGSVLAPTQEGYVATVDGGAMIDGDRFQALEALIQDAEEGGANVIGGRQYNHVYLENGYYFQPTVVGPVDNSMEIAQQELFAPIALLMPYETVEEAIELANGTRYGLGASVFGPSQSKCLEVAKRLECGMVSINDFAVFYMNQDLPFGGCKASGYGRFGGPEGLRALTNPKAIMVDRWPNLIQTSIPPVLDYPLRSLLQSWEFASGLVRFLYADGARNWMYGLYGLIQAASKGGRR
ncbi:Aldehyde/histidinol dehydrogenase [Schizophyllum commune]|nr:ALDH-like protein [Schizophyllum commune Loenen D]